MKRKASKQLSKRAKGKDGSTQVASLVTEIDPDGDLQMDFVDRTDDSGGQLHGLQVSKHILRLSSPVFRTMLADDSPFLESRNKTTNKNGIQVIYFEEDDLASMEILMNAIHLQDHRVPITLEIAQLEELAVVCDKYDIRCLERWAERWSQPYLYQGCTGLASPLFVAMVFRLADWFVHLTKDLILCTTSSSEGELLLEDSSRFREGVPQSILDRIAERRTEAIAQLLEICWQQSRELRTARGHCCFPWRPRRERRNCDTINLGGLSLHSLDLSRSPLDAVDLISISAKSIFSSIRKFPRRSDVTTADDRFTTDHASCCIGDDVISRARSVVRALQGIELEPVASEAPPQESTLLLYLSALLEKFHTTGDTPTFEVVTRLTAVPNDTNFWRKVTTRSQATSDTRSAWCPKLKCNYCPGFEYSLFQNHSFERTICRALERHVENTLHCERVRRRKREIRRRTCSEAAPAT